MLSDRTSVELIQYNSREYRQACELRYRLFFAEHNLPWAVVDNQSDRDYFHLAIIDREKLLAYAQLDSQENLIYRIRQMVVEPSHQKQGLGRQILSTAIALAIQKDATSVLLDSRLSAVGFYQTLGFETYGVEFPSSTTGVMHIAMKLEL